MTRRFRTPLFAAAMLCFTVLTFADTPHKQVITAYTVPDAPVTGPLPAAAVLHLAIALTPRDAPGLRALADAVSNPKSPQFRHFLTLDQVTERYGPSAADYQALILWAQSNHLTVEAQYSHRLMLAVKGSSADVERALAIKLSYAKRADGSLFYKPDRAPSLDSDVKISHIAGVDNLFVPRHFGRSGSITVPSGTAYSSADLRTAYASSCLGLTGAGQAVGIMGYYGYNPSDITTFEKTAGIWDGVTACGLSTPGSAPCINNVAVNSFTMPYMAGSDGSGEATGDIEMPMLLAPGLTQVVVFQSGADPAATNPGCAAGDETIAAFNTRQDIKQFSSSVGYCADDDIPILDSMASTGQSFFASSGDYGTGFNVGNAVFNVFGAQKITPVGGSILKMKGTGHSYDSEVAWSCSGGGVENFSENCSQCSMGFCPNNCIPSYQVGVANAQNGASSTYRNDPDIAMPADGAFAFSDGLAGTFGGTSASSPLMAGFMALANQQCTASGTCNPAMGFISPSLYAIGLDEDTFATSFHDIIGTQTATMSCGGSANTSAAPAVKGYDLATGWGSPTCGLIDQLACTTCSGTTSAPGTLPSTSCVSFQSNSNNCGSCGNVCSMGTSCVSGTCQVSSDDGDTHITTFDGFYYDFQASGEFVLAKVGTDFELQSRQASGAPRWPLAAVNKAVAMKMGKTSVALCIEPTQLLVDGKPGTLADGKSLSLADGVTVKRTGQTYLISRAGHESVQAELNATWIDLSVGLGRSMHGPVSGLLGNANGNPGDDIALNGAFGSLKQPVTFEDLYHRYGQSWVLKPEDSLLCGAKKAPYIIPSKPFLVTDLEPRERQLARDTCTAAGVRDTTLLEACTLDNAVLADKTATKVYLRTPRPVATLHLAPPVVP